jgi:hypothetical protein
MQMPSAGNGAGGSESESTWLASASMPRPVALPESLSKASSAPKAKGPPPVRTLELVRAKFDKMLNIDQLKQTFLADVFFEFKIRGGAHDPDLTREGDGPPSTVFPQDTLRPSARWYLNQFE